MATKRTAKRSTAARRPRAGTPSQAQYESRERAEFNQLVRSKDKESLTERQEARDEFLGAMAERPGTVGERIEWLLDGNYGYGGMLIAKEVIANKRMNREAWLVGHVGAIDWNCPIAFGLGAWKKLSKAQKDALSAAVKRAIKRSES